MTNWLNTINLFNFAKFDFITYPMATFMLIYYQSRNMADLFALIVSMIFGAVGYVYVQNTVKRIQSRLTIPEQRNLTIIKATRFAIPDYSRQIVLIGIYASLLVLSAAALLQTALVIVRLPLSFDITPNLMMLAWGVIMFSTIAYFLVSHQQELHLEKNRYHKQMSA